MGSNAERAEPINSTHKARLVASIVCAIHSLGVTPCHNACGGEAWKSISPGESIPASLGSLGNLQVLDLSKNQLTGAIPTALGSLSRLTSLALSNNSLTGNVPSALGNLTKLTNLDLSTNRMSGLISLQVARSLGVFESQSPCSLAGNRDLRFGTDPGSRAADLNHDGSICLLPVP